VGQRQRGRPVCSQISTSQLDRQPGLRSHEQDLAVSSSLPAPAAEVLGGQNNQNRPQTLGKGSNSSLLQPVPALLVPSSQGCGSLAPSPVPAAGSSPPRPVSHSTPRRTRRSGAGLGRPRDEESGGRQDVEGAPAAAPPRMAGRRAEKTSFSPSARAPGGGALS